MRTGLPSMRTEQFARGRVRLRCARLEGDSRSRTHQHNPNPTPRGSCASRPNRARHCALGRTLTPLIEHECTTCSNPSSTHPILPPLNAVVNSLRDELKNLQTIPYKSATRLWVGDGEGCCVGIEGEKSRLIFCARCAVRTRDNAGSDKGYSVK